jgi:hypothetical protein
MLANTQAFRGQIYFGVEVDKRRLPFTSKIRRPMLPPRLDIPHRDAFTAVDVFLKRDDISERGSETAR